jgi:hypothetical protein
MQFYSLNFCVKCRPWYLEDFLVFWHQLLRAALLVAPGGSALGGDEKDGGAQVPGALAHQLHGDTQEVPRRGMYFLTLNRVAPVQGTASCPPPPPHQFFLFNLPFTLPPKLPLVWLAVSRKPLFCIFQKTSCQCFVSVSTDPLLLIRTSGLRIRILFFSSVAFMILITRYRT